MTLADRIVILRKRNIEAIGSPMELYRSPASKFVAGFIAPPKTGEPLIVSHPAAGFARSPTLALTGSAAACGQS